MSRSNYDDSGDDLWGLIRWRGAVASAIRGRRGQAFMRELLAALDAMPEKRLIRNQLEQAGEVCALGCLGRARGINMLQLDPAPALLNLAQVAETFGIAEALAREIVYENDESWNETPEQRWKHMRRWVVAQVRESESFATESAKHDV